MPFLYSGFPYITFGFLIAGFHRMQRAGYHVSSDTALLVKFYGMTSFCFISLGVTGNVKIVRLTE